MHVEEKLIRSNTNSCTLVIPSTSMSNQAGEPAETLQNSLKRQLNALISLMAVQVATVVSAISNGYHKLKKQIIV